MATICVYFNIQKKMNISMVYKQYKKKKSKREYTLTVFILIVALYDRFSCLPGDKKPFTCVGQVLVLDGQVLDQNALTLRQSVRVWAEQLIVLVLVLIITVARREYVIIKLYHRNHAGMQQIFRIHDFRTGVLPKPRQHVGSINGNVGFHAEPFLKLQSFFSISSLSFLIKW